MTNDTKHSFTSSGSCHHPEHFSCKITEIDLGFLNLGFLLQSRVSQSGPLAPLGGHEQRPSLGNFAVILHNTSVTMY